MWKPIRIHFERFLSHLNSSYTFDQGKTFIITGRNETDEGQGSNGSGKSTVIEAIAIALTGDPFRKVSVKELIGDDYDDCVIEFELRNSVTEQMLYIKRVLHRKKTQKMMLLLDGEDQVNKFGGDPREGNKLLEQLIGINKEDLLNYFIVSNEKYSSFFTSTDGAKKNIINRFSNAEMVNPVFAIIKNEILDLDEQVSEFEDQIHRAEGSIDVLTEQMGTVAEKASTVQQKIDDYRKQIKDNNVGSASSTAAIKILQEGRPVVQKEIELLELDIQQNEDIIEAEEQQLETFINDKKQLNNDLVELTHFQAHIQAIVDGKIKCPSCGFEFALQDQSIDPAKAEKELPTLLKEIEDTQTSLRKVERGIEQANKHLQQNRTNIRNLKLGIAEQNRELEAIDRDIKKQQNNIVDYKSLNESIERQIDQLNNLDTSKELMEIGKKIEDHQNDIIVVKKEIEKIRGHINQLNSLDNHFVRFKSFLANQSIASIEGFVNSYLQRIHTNLEVQINGYRMLADGKTLKEEIEVNVLRNGMVRGKFAKFSGGEKVRIDICGILTLQKLINLNCEDGKGLDLLLIDEVADSLDYEGISEVVHSLNNLNINIGIISQVKDGDFDNQLLVVKREGKSEII